MQCVRAKLCHSVDPNEQIGIAMMIFAAKEFIESRLQQQNKHWDEGSEEEKKNDSKWQWKKEKHNIEGEKNKRTTPGIPTWSPAVVLTGPDDA